MIGEPKSKSGYRDIPLTEEAITILRNQQEKIKMIKVINMQFSEFVFLCRKGEPTKACITMNLYVQVTEDEKIKEVEKIERALKIV